jgi:hypothetical protein
VRDLTQKRFLFTPRRSGCDRPIANAHGVPHQNWPWLSMRRVATILPRGTIARSAFAHPTAAKARVERRERRGIIPARNGL